MHFTMVPWTTNAVLGKHLVRDGVPAHAESSRRHGFGPPPLPPVSAEHAFSLLAPKLPKLEIFLLNKGEYANRYLVNYLIVFECLSGQ